jgi:hypothetical protein
MSNWNTGPKSHAEATKMAQQSQKNTHGANTSNWNWTAKQTYFANGGR